MFDKKEKKIKDLWLSYLFIHFFKAFIHIRLSVLVKEDNKYTHGHSHGPSELLGRVTETHCHNSLHIHHTTGKGKGWANLCAQLGVAGQGGVRNLI